jgi:hypothetical protein
MPENKNETVAMTGHVPALQKMDTVQNLLNT